jgi:hypothetical protein
MSPNVHKSLQARDPNFPVRQAAKVQIAESQNGSEELHITGKRKRKAQNALITENLPRDKLQGPQSPDVHFSA